MSPSSGSYKSFVKYFLPRAACEIVHFAHICIADKAQVPNIFHPPEGVPVSDFTASPS